MVGKCRFVWSTLAVNYWVTNHQKSADLFTIEGSLSHYTITAQIRFRSESSGCFRYLFVVCSRITWLIEWADPPWRFCAIALFGRAIHRASSVLFAAALQCGISAAVYLLLPLWSAFSWMQYNRVLIAVRISLHFLRYAPPWRTRNVPKKGRGGVTGNWAMTCNGFPIRSNIGIRGIGKKHTKQDEEANTQ